jgi:hypothetical protein
LRPNLGQLFLEFVIGFHSGRPDLLFLQRILSASTQKRTVRTSDEPSGGVLFSLLGDDMRQFRRAASLDLAA